MSLLTGMLNPCITINYKITKHGEGRSKAECDAHLKSKGEITHVAQRVRSYSISIWGCAVAFWFGLWKQWDYRASGLAGSRLGSPSSGFSPGATAYLASRGRVNTPSHWSATCMLMSSCRPARRYARLRLAGSAGQWCGDWRRWAEWEAPDFKARDGRRISHNGAQCSLSTSLEWIPDGNQHGQFSRWCK